MGIDFFGTLLNVSLSMSAIIALLTLVSPLLRKRYRAGWRCLAWLAVSLRLLVPVSVPIPNAPVRISISNPEALPEPAAPPVISNLPSQAAAVTPAAPSLKSEQIITAIYVAGIICFFTVQLISYLRFRRRVKYAPQREPSPQIKEIWNTSIPALKISAAVSSPIITGLFKPLLLLPHEDYARNELEYIFRHELVHYRRGHLWFKLFITLVNGLHWFNPFVYLMVSQAGRDIEMSCDDRVKAELNDKERAVYGKAILDALPVKNIWRIEPMLTTSFGSTKKTVKGRLINLFDKTVKKKGAAAFCAALALIVTISGLVAFTPAPAEASETAGIPTETVDAVVLESFQTNRDWKKVSDFLPYMSADAVREVARMTNGYYSPPDVSEYTKAGRVPDKLLQYEQLDEIMLWLMNETGTWDYVKAWEPYMTAEGLEAMVEVYKEKGHTDPHSEAYIINQNNSFSATRKDENLNKETGASRKASLELDFERYADYGVTYDTGQDAVFYNGERVKLFVDFMRDKEPNMVYAFDVCYIDENVNSGLYLEAVENNSGEIVGIIPLDIKIADELLGGMVLNDTTETKERSNALIFKGSAVFEAYGIYATDRELAKENVYSGLAKENVPQEVKDWIAECDKTQGGFTFTNKHDDGYITYVYYNGGGRFAWEMTADDESVSINWLHTIPSEGGYCLMYFTSPKEYASIKLYRNDEPLANV